MLRKILSYFMVLLAFVITGAFYVWFDLEGILWDGHEQTEITAAQIKKSKWKNYTGKEAGKGIKELKTKKDWNKLTGETGYATVTPKEIEKTGVYSLAKWESYNTKKKNVPIIPSRRSSCSLALSFPVTTKKKHSPSFTTP